MPYLDFLSFGGPVAPALGEVDGRPSWKHHSFLVTFYGDLPKRWFQGMGLRVKNLGEKVGPQSFDLRMFIFFEMGWAATSNYIPGLPWVNHLCDLHLWLLRNFLLMANKNPGKKFPI